MTPEQAEALRKPFPADVVGKLPRIWCRSCSEAKRGGGTCGPQHPKQKCRDCHNNITTAHLHLDYVGHAETTDRFLQVDPEWTWEPMSFGPNGLPQLDENGALWIRLTIAGVTRIGYGSADGKKGPDAIKECIGDALRNAGMRFGVALDLWGAKFKGDDDGGEPDGEVHGRGEADPWESAQPARPARQPEQPEPSREEVIAKARQAIATATLPAIEPIRAQITTRNAEKIITDEDSLTLFAEVNAREAELNGNLVPDSVPADAPDPGTAKPAGLGIQDDQKRRMFALFNEMKTGDRVKQMDFIRAVVRRPVESRVDLTYDEAYNVIGALESQKKMGAGRTDRHLTAVNGS